MAISTAINLPRFIDEYEGYKMRQMVDEIERLHAALTRDIDEEGTPSSVDSFNGRFGDVVPIQADYDSFFLTPAEGNAAYSALGHTHGSGDLTDFDFTGAADNDLLYGSGGVWVDTAGKLTWDGSVLAVNVEAATSSILDIGETTTLRGDGQDSSLRLWGEQTGVIKSMTISNSGANLGYNANGGSHQFNDNMQVLGGHTFQILDSTNSDSVTFSHDGTDFNTAFTTTADWNITGLTGRVRFNDIGLDSIQFSDGADTQIVEMVSGWITLGTGTGGSLGVDLSPKTTWLGTTDVRGGATFDILDSTNTDKAAFSHDGTDFNTAFTTTTDWNITGLTGRILQDAETLAYVSEIPPVDDGTVTDSTLRWSGSAWVENTNVLALSGGNFFAGNIFSASTTPGISFEETDASATNKNWGIAAGSEEMWWNTINDVGGFGEYIFRVARTGTAVDYVGTPQEFRVMDAAMLDWAAFSHDGTDFNTAFTNTTDWNVTGLTGRARFNDIGLDSIQFSDGADTQIVEMVSGWITLGTGTGGSLGVDLSPKTTWLGTTDVRGGATFDILDSTNTDKAAFSHDGTDFNTAFTTTADWNITGLTGRILQGAETLAYVSEIGSTIAAGTVTDSMLRWSGSAWVESTDLKLNSAGSLSLNIQSAGNSTFTMGESTTLRGNGQNAILNLYGEDTSAIKLAQFQNTGALFWMNLGSLPFQMDTTSTTEFTTSSFRVFESTGIDSIQLIPHLTSPIIDFDGASTASFTGPTSAQGYLFDQGAQFGGNLTIDTTIPTLTFEISGTSRASMTALATSFTIDVSTQSSGKLIDFTNGLTSMVTIDATNGLRVFGGGQETDYLEFDHDGTDAFTRYLNTTWHRFDGISSTGGWLFLDGGEIRVYDSTSVDYIRLRHDGADAYIDTNAGAVIIPETLNIQDNLLTRAVMDDYSLVDTNATVSANAVTCTYSTSQSYEVDLEAATGNVTITISGGPPTNRYGEMIVKVQQDSTANRTLTWAGGTFIWPGGTEIEPKTGSDAITIYYLSTWNAGTTWYINGVEYG